MVRLFAGRVHYCVLIASLLAGSLAAAQTTLSPTSLSFGSIALGNSSNSKSVALKNTQSVPLNNIVGTPSPDYAVTATTHVDTGSGRQLQLFGCVPADGDRHRQWDADHH